MRNEKNCDNCYKFPECRYYYGLLDGKCADWKEQSEEITCDLCKDSLKNLHIVKVRDAEKAARSGWWYVDKMLICPECMKKRAQTKGPWKLGASKAETIEIIRWRAGK